MASPQNPFATHLNVIADTPQAVPAGLVKGAGGVDAVSATTPRPWRTGIGRASAPAIASALPNLLLAEVFTFDGAARIFVERHEDAALIVRAVNAHDDLVAALRALVEEDAGPQCTHLMLGGSRCTLEQKYHGSPQQFLGPVNNHFFESGPDESPMDNARALLRDLDAEAEP